MKDKILDYANTQFRQLKHYVFFSAHAYEIFELLLDEKKHEAYTGGAARIDRRIDGKFTTFGGMVEGVTKELEPSRLIVQEWRGADWPAEHYSLARFELKPIHGGRCCALKLDQTAVPSDKVEEVNEGWEKYYWTPMTEYLRNQKVAVVRRFLEEFKNQARLDVVDETWTVDCVLHVPGFQVPPGRRGQKEVGKAIFDAFSKVHVEPHDTIVEGDRVVERHKATAIHKGEFMGVPASGKKVFWTENHIYRLENDLIAETWSEVSFHDLINQIRN